MTHEDIDKLLLTTGTASWGAYGIFHAVSEFCKLLLPITGVASFLIYLLINRKKIKEAWNNWRGKNKSTSR